MRDDELEQLLIAQAPRLLGLARRLAPHGIDAADLLQDTAERAWAARAQITDHDQAPAWLRRILVNRLRDLARRRALITFSALETAGDPPDITVQDPLAVLQTVERDGQLRAALRTLPGDELLAVVLTTAKAGAPQTSQPSAAARPRPRTSACSADACA